MAIRATGLFIYCLWVGSAFAARADDSPPPIRSFDIATTEKLGRDMYKQDQLAWKATDALFEQHSRSDLRAAGLAGWIVETAGDHNVVRFVRKGVDGPGLFYDVTLDRSLLPAVTIPATTALSSEELAQYNARTIATEGIKQRCSDNYNTIVLKDPESNGWLVWVMAASNDPDAIVIGGHYRFTISADGKSVLHADALSRGCLMLHKKDLVTQIPESAVPGGIMFNHLVSLAPIETYVFDSLEYARPFYVGTLDGRAWKIVQGNISTIEQGDSEADGFVARTLAGRDETCRMILGTANASNRKFSIGPETHVILATEHAEKFSVDAPADAILAGVACARDDIVPSPNDYKVAMAGMDLMISDRGAGHPRRMGTLKLEDGKYTFNITHGEPLTDDLKSSVAARLAKFPQPAPAAP